MPFKKKHSVQIPPQIEIVFFHFSGGPELSIDIYDALQQAVAERAGYSVQHSI